MIEHSPVCWEHEGFKAAILRVSNSEVYYRAINFYLSEQPLKLSELLIDLSAKLDHKRVIGLVESQGHLPLIKKYLKHVQREDQPPINEALNGLYLQEERYQELRDSVQEFVAFDQINLAQKLEKHDLIEFRRIAAILYKLNGRAAQSIELSKGDKLWKDAIQTAAESSEVEVVEDLVRFFVNNPDVPQSVFGAALYTCYHLIRPDIALELAWRNNLQEFVTPYMIQSFRDLTDRVSALENRLEKREKKESDEETAKKEAENMLQNQSANSMLMLTNAPAPQYANMGQNIGFAPAPGFVNPAAPQGQFVPGPRF